MQMYDGNISDLEQIYFFIECSIQGDKRSWILVCYRKPSFWICYIFFLFFFAESLILPIT